VQAVTAAEITRKTKARKMNPNIAFRLFGLEISFGMGNSFSNQTSVTSMAAPTLRPTQKPTFLKSVLVRESLYE
jgi:hypothetical protein